MTDWLRIVSVGATVLILLLAGLMPLRLTPDPYPLPDLVFCVFAAVTVRNPRLAPRLLVAGLVLAGDFVLFRPIGLWTAIMLLAMEFLRHRVGSIQEFPFLYEWMITGTAFASALLTNYVILAIFLLPRPDSVASVLLVLTTLLAYPFVVIFVNLVLRIRKPLPTGNN